MTATYVTLVLDRYDGQGHLYVRGGGTLRPSLEFPDAADQMLVGTAPVPFLFSPAGPPRVRLLPNDLYGPQQEGGSPGWTWNVAYDPDTPGSPAAASYYILSTSGSVQYLSDLASTPAAQPGQQYLPLPSGSRAVGAVPVWDGTGLAWSTAVILDTSWGA